MLRFKVGDIVYVKPSSWTYGQRPQGPLVVLRNSPMNAPTCELATQDFSARDFRRFYFDDEDLVTELEYLQIVILESAGVSEP